MTNRKSNVNQANNSTLILQVSNDLTVQVHKNPDHEFLMTTSEVAHGYDCSIDAIKKAKNRNSNDFIEGKHFILTPDKMSVEGRDNLSLPLIEKINIQPNQIYWTKKGIIRLGFMLKCSRAILFRDWAEDLIIGKLQSKYRLPLRADEEQLLASVHHYLVKGNIKQVATEMQVTPSHVTDVKNGRKRSHRVMQALVNKAVFNKNNNVFDGYQNAFIQSSLNLL